MYLFSISMMEDAGSSEMSTIIYQATRRHIPGDSIFTGCAFKNPSHICQHKGIYLNTREETA
jgi:hypothetical protein